MGVMLDWNEPGLISTPSGVWKDDDPEAIAQLYINARETLSGRSSKPLSPAVEKLLHDRVANAFLRPRPI